MESTLGWLRSKDLGLRSPGRSCELYEAIYNLIALHHLLGFSSSFCSWSVLLLFLPWSFEGEAPSGLTSTVYYSFRWFIFLCWNGLVANPGSWSHVVLLLVLTEILMLNLFLQLLPLVVKVISARWHQVEQMASFFFLWLVFQVRSCCCDVISHSFWTINFTYILFPDFDLHWEILVYMQFKFHMANSKVVWKDTLKQINISNISYISGFPTDKISVIFSFGTEDWIEPRAPTMVISSSYRKWIKYLDF